MLCVKVKQRRVEVLLKSIILIAYLCQVFSQQVYVLLECFELGFVCNQASCGMQTGKVLAHNTCDIINIACN